MVIIFFLFSLKVDITENVTENLFFSIFNRYVFCFVIFPVQIINILSLFKIRINDIYVFRTRKIITYQIFFNIIIVIGIFYMVLTLGVIIFQGFINNINLFKYIDLAIYLLAMLYASVVSIVYCLFTFIILFLTDNKIIAFIITIGFNLIMFILSVDNKFVLFFYFTLFESPMGYMGNLFILVGVIIFFIYIIENIVNRKEFK